MNFQRAAKQVRSGLMSPMATGRFLHAFSDRNTRVPALRRLAYWPGLGISYNKLKKNANTSVLLLLDRVSSVPSASRREAKWRTLGLFDLPSSELKRLRDYHYFVVIRDPYSRVLSAFLDKFRHNEFRIQYGAFTLDPEGFGAFLGWLEAGGLGRDPHWDLQTKLMVWSLDRYDTVIRFESFASDMGEFLTKRQIEVAPELLQDVLPADQDKKTSATERMDQFYTPALRSRVAELYNDDFLALGYPR